MLIKRIKAKNFKTYLNLDLDISVEDDKPIILIGGVNGGGKTTFFEAIYGALYGLNITTAKTFRELLNAGAINQTDDKIELELHFSGRVLNEEQEYILSRTYILNTADKPVEAVKLNMNGTIFNYGTATPVSQRAEQEAQVNKIIKANLPQELSRYFLFDAMEAGNLLKEDQLNRVIKENIERGIEEGIYRDEFHPEIIAKLYVGKTMVVIDEDIFPLKDYNKENLFKEHIQYHIRGIATSKGLKLLEKHFKKLS